MSKKYGFGKVLFGIDEFKGHRAVVFKDFYSLRVIPIGVSEIKFCALKNIKVKSKSGVTGYSVSKKVEKGKMKILHSYSFNDLYDFVAVARNNRSKSAMIYIVDCFNTFSVKYRVNKDIKKVCGGVFL